MIIKVKISKSDNNELKEYANKHKINYETAAGRAVKAFLRAQKLKKEINA